MHANAMLLNCFKVTLLQCYTDLIYCCYNFYCITPLLLLQWYNTIKLLLLSLLLVNTLLCLLIVLSLGLPIPMWPSMRRLLLFALIQSNSSRDICHTLSNIRSQDFGSSTAPEFTCTVVYSGVRFVGMAVESKASDVKWCYCITSWHGVLMPCRL